jgi:hypothetical protein
VKEKSLLFLRGIEPRIFQAVKTGIKMETKFTWKPAVSSRIILNPLNAEFNPICYLLAILGAQQFLHVSGIRVKTITKFKPQQHAAIPSVTAL